MQFRSWTEAIKTILMFSTILKIPLECYLVPFGPRDLKLHASIQLFTSTLNLSHLANYSVHIGCHKPNLIYKPKTKGGERGEKKTPTISISSLWIFSLDSPLILFGFWHLCHSPSELLRGCLELIPNTMRMSRSESHLSCVASSTIFWHNVTLLSYVLLYQQVTFLYNVSRTTFMIYICFHFSKRQTNHQNWGDKKH